MQQAISKFTQKFPVEKVEEFALFKVDSLKNTLTILDATATLRMLEIRNLDELVFKEKSARPTKRRLAANQVYGVEIASLPFATTARGHEIPKALTVLDDALRQINGLDEVCGAVSGRES